MNDFPSSWAYSTLEKVGLWGSGGTPKRTIKDYYDGPIPWLVIGDLNDGLVTSSKNTITESGLVNSSAKLLKEGTLLIGMYGSIGKLGIAGVECATNQAIASCVVDNEIVSRNYLFYFLMSRRRHLLSLGKGGAQQNISQSVLKAYEVPLAPLNEQIRIANKLDSLLAKVDDAQKRLEKIPTLLKRFRQSVLNAATSGDLTREWRKIKDNNWPKVALKNVASGFDYGSSIKSQNKGQVPVLRMGNIQSGKLDWTNLVYTSDDSEITKYLLSPGDVLFNRTNSPELVGKTAIYRGEQKSIFAGYLIRIKGTEKINSEYLNLQLNSPDARDYCWQVKTDGVSQSNINAKKIQAYEFELPPMLEQKEIVRRVESLFSLADSVEKQYLEAKKRIDRLTQSLLAKAFRGELVPQDPNDEPASELLKRIQAERTVQSEIKPIRKTVTASKKEKKVVMKLHEAPEHYLLDLLTQLGGEIDAKVLWNKTELGIDDFYAKLKQEMQTGRIVDDKASSDPTQRKLKLA